MSKLFKTHGIALKLVKYRETSIIVKVYTEQFGMKSYVVNGVRSSKGKSNKIALYQPLTLLDMVVYNHEARDINRISEAKILYPYQSVPFEVMKSSVAIFLTEVLVKALHTEEANPDLFGFLKQQLLGWDQGAIPAENFHLRFLLALSERLGFGVQSEDDFFHELDRHMEIEPETRQAMHQLIVSHEVDSLKLNGRTRAKLAELLVAFFHLHLENFGSIQSLSVLKELMNS